MGAGEVAVGPADSGTVAETTLGILGAGNRLRLRALNRPSEVLIAAGRPLRAPIVQRGPFVMNTEAEIERAIADYCAGLLACVRPSRRYALNQGEQRPLIVLKSQQSSRRKAMNGRIDTVTLDETSLDDVTGGNGLAVAGAIAVGVAGSAIWDGIKWAYGKYVDAWDVDRPPYTRE